MFINKKKELYNDMFILDEDGIFFVIFSVRNQNGEFRDYVIEMKNKGNLKKNLCLNLNLM